MEIRLDGKIALVTGAGSGIGRAIAIELGQSGAHVIVHYRNSEAGAKETLDCIKQAGGSGEVAKADLVHAAQVDQLMGDIKAKSGHLDILVNNAGTLVKRSKIVEMSEALFDEVMDVNFKTTFLCCRAAVPLMTGRGWGRIVNMSSVAAHDGGGNGATICAASKAAIAPFTKGFAKELAPLGKTVNCAAPGLIRAAPFHDTY